MNEQQGSNLTPFLPSNQLPGPFRPILSYRNYTQQPQYQSTVESPKHIRYSPVNNILKESVPIALANSQHLSAHEVEPTSTHKIVEIFDVSSITNFSSIQRNIFYRHIMLHQHHHRRHSQSSTMVLTIRLCSKCMCWSRL